MTDFDIDAAQQLCDNATEGPWEPTHAEGNTSGGAAEHERLSHAQMVAAAEKARQRVAPFGERNSFRSEAVARNAHVDDLLAILRLHEPTDHRPGSWCGECSAVATLRPWPCPTVQLVADRLTGWGVL